MTRAHKLAFPAVAAALAASVAFGWLAGVGLPVHESELLDNHANLAAPLAVLLLPLLELQSAFDVDRSAFGEVFANGLPGPAERSAINAPMQGTAADIIQRAMIDVDAWLQSSRAPARLIMQVHDELVLEVADDAVETLVQQLRQHMAHAADLDVPLKVDVGIGRSWDEAH